MNIMELGAIGELVGGAAVLATLVYLAMQVRQGTQVARAQVQQETSRMSTELFLNADRETLDLFARAANDPKGISESDLRYARGQFVAVVNYYETLFYAWHRGDVETDLWESRRFRMGGFIGSLRELCWEPTKGYFGKRFQEFVDGDLLSNLPDVDSPWLYGGPSK